MALSNKEKKVLCCIAFAWPIILVTCIVGYVTGAWLVPICMVVVTTPFVKLLAAKYWREISCLIDDIFSFLNTLANPLAQQSRKMKNFLFAPAMNPQPSIPATSISQARSTHTEMYFILCAISTRQNSILPTYSAITLLIALVFTQLQLQLIAQAYRPSVPQMNMLSRTRRTCTERTSRRISHPSGNECSTLSPSQTTTHRSISP